eukprot:14690839-Heterocapsa_arctica.AAC.1
MRASYLGQDRADIQMAVKERARHMKELTVRDMTECKRLARYLRLKPRVVQHSPGQHFTDSLTVCRLRSRRVFANTQVNHGHGHSTRNTHSAYTERHAEQCGAQQRRVGVRRPS